MTDNKTLIRELIRLRDALIEIERFGHGDGHGRGFTCADMAQQALKGTDVLYQSNSIGS